MNLYRDPRSGFDDIQQRAEYTQEVDAVIDSYRRFKSRLERTIRQSIAYRDERVKIEEGAIDGETELIPTHIENCERNVKDFCEESCYIDKDTLNAYLNQITIDSINVNHIMTMYIGTAVTSASPKTDRETDVLRELYIAHHECRMVAAFASPISRFFTIRSLRRSNRNAAIERLLMNGDQDE
ncbi:hypothetical protein COV93_01600 [Candidatus Woesearchaeota archaeon CG11_big_fil_rev_8_21_14_0_20_43_8]|nr:MAG: hypothetical protein COV93_01600 [Candidatus Woesearchaeota archaeon CG11_big_fil_rev_8_21_14_0_20_43_8]PIO06573.1 MAG: hypothetical protein COT47_03310 [Candidatus Woesearchaeota archaeon CG08_land_8_20_14_0_20_43_7]